MPEFNLCNLKYVKMVSKTMLCSLQYIDPATAVMMVLKAFMKYESLTFSFAEFGSRVCQ